MRLNKGKLCGARRAREILRVRSDNKYSALQMRDEAATIAVYKLRRIFDAVRPRGYRGVEGGEGGKDRGARKGGRPRESREAMICNRKNHSRDTAAINEEDWGKVRSDASRADAWILR